MVKKLLTTGLILASVWMILFFPRMMHKTEAEPSISRHDCLTRDAVCDGTIETLGQVSLQIEPADLPVMKPLMLTIKVPVNAVEAVSLQFVGQDMDMGLQPVTLTRNPEASGPLAGRRRHQPVYGESRYVLVGTGHNHGVGQTAYCGVSFGASYTLIVFMGGQQRSYLLKYQAFP